MDKELNEFRQCIKNVRKFCEEDCKKNMLCYYIDKEGVELCYEDYVWTCMDVICTHFYHVYNY